MNLGISETLAAGLLAFVSLYSYQQLALPYCSGEPHTLPEDSLVAPRYPCNGSALSRSLFIVFNSPLILWDICRLKYEDSWATLGIPLLFLRFVGAFCLPDSVYGQLVVPITSYAVRLMNTVWHVAQGPNFTPSAMALASLFSKHAPFEVVVFLSTLGSWRASLALEVAACAWSAASTALLLTWYAARLPLGVTLRGQLLTRALVLLANVYLERLFRRGGGGGGGRGGTGRGRAGGRGCRADGLSGSGGSAAGADEAAEAEVAGPEGAEQRKACGGPGTSAGGCGKVAGAAAKAPAACTCAAEGEGAAGQPPGAGACTAGGRGYAAAAGAVAAGPTTTAAAVTATASATAGKGQLPRGAAAEEPAGEAAETVPPAAAPCVWVPVPVPGCGATRPAASPAVSAQVTARLPVPPCGSCGGSGGGSGCPGAAPDAPQLPPYRSPLQRRRVWIKIPWAEPEQLAPDHVSRLAKLVGDHGLVLAGAYVRRGCVELVMVLEERPTGRGRGREAAGSAGGGPPPGAPQPRGGPQAPRWALELGDVLEALGLPPQEQQQPDTASDAQAEAAFAAQVALLSAPAPVPNTIGLAPTGAEAGFLWHHIEAAAGGDAAAAVAVAAAPAAGLVPSPLGAVAEETQQLTRGGAVAWSGGAVAWAEGEGEGEGCGEFEGWLRGSAAAAPAPAGPAAAGAISLPPGPVVVRALPRVLQLPPPGGCGAPPGEQHGWDDVALPSPAAPIVLRVLVAFPRGASEEREREHHGGAQAAPHPSAGTCPGGAPAPEVLVRSAGAYLPARVAAVRPAPPPPQQPPPPSSSDSGDDADGDGADDGEGGEGAGGGGASPSEAAAASGEVAFFEYDIELTSAPAQPGGVMVELRFATRHAHGGSAAQLHHAAAPAAPAAPRAAVLTVPLLATPDPALAAELSAAAAAWPAWPAEGAADLDDLLYDMATWTRVTAPAAAAAGGGAAGGDAAACAMWSPLGEHLLRFAEAAGWAATAARIRADLGRRRERQAGRQLQQPCACGAAQEGVAAPRGALLGGAGASGDATASVTVFRSSGAGCSARGGAGDARGSAGCGDGAEAVGGWIAKHGGWCSEGGCGCGCGRALGYGPRCGACGVGGKDAALPFPTPSACIAAPSAAPASAAASCAPAPACTWRARWLLALAAAPGLRPTSTEAEDAVAFRAFVNDWAVPLSAFVNALECLMLLSLLVRGALSGQAVLGLPNAALLMGLGTGAVATAAWLLLPPGASAAVQGAARLPGFAGYVASKALLVLGR